MKSHSTYSLVRRSAEILIPSRVLWNGAQKFSTPDEMNAGDTSTLF